MKIIRAGFELLPRNEERGNLNVIELAGRTCYKSEDKIAEGSSEKFAKGIMAHGHEAMMEHGDMIFQVDDPHIIDNVSEGLQMLKDRGLGCPMLEMTRRNGKRRCIVSGNIRAWRELFATSSLAGAYFIGHFDPLYVKGFKFFDEDVPPDERVHQIRYADLKDYGEKLAHHRETVRFTIDRGISHEFVRHRVFSFAQESTRYCNYSKGKFGSELTFIEPCYLGEGTKAYEFWERACVLAEDKYFELLEYGLQPQEARAVLPNSVKTELVMTGNLRAWMHFFNLRARQLSGKAHPQAVEVAYPLYELFKVLHPDIFSD